MFGRRREKKRLGGRVHVRGRQAAARLSRVEHELERARAEFAYDKDLVFKDAHWKHIRRACELLSEVIDEAHEILNYALQLKHALIKQRAGNYVEHEVLTGVERSVEGNARALEERAKRLRKNLEELLLTNIHNDTLRGRDGERYCQDFDGLLVEATGIAGIVHQLEEQEVALRE